MKTVSYWLLTIAMFGSLTANASSGILDGLPVPWPFPWAKECPIQWQALDGYYELSSASGPGTVTMRIKVTQRGHLNLIRVIRYSAGDSWIYEGATYVGRNQKFIRLYLSPAKKSGPAIWAVIKLHYTSKSTNCAETNLVPILTIQKHEDEPETYTNYKLVRLGD